jgi:signal transduction histidine kinase
MVVGQELLGVLDVQSSQRAAFGPDDVRIQSSLASQVAVALQNAGRYQEQLQTAEKLREVDRLKSEFLASMSHELRTPLNSIIGFADVLLEGLDGELTPRMEEDVSLIRNSGQHLRNLIGDILDMSKIEAGKMELNFEKLDPAAIVREVMANAAKFAKTYDKEHLELEVDIEEELPRIDADRTRLIQVLYNLVSNAIKFTSEGSVTVFLRREAESLRVAVRDTGIGIDPNHADLVFEQFRQVDGSMTRKSGGTGLGLPITRHLVGMHGGDIWLESEPGAGTTFHVRLPIRRSQPVTES